MIDKGKRGAARWRAMLHAISLTLAQLRDRRIIAVFVKSLALTLLIFALLGVAAIYGARMLANHYGWGSDGGIAATLIATFGTIAAGWLLFRAVAMPVISLFADEVVAAIEARHYPAAATSAHRVSITTSLGLASGSVVRLILANLAALPFYAILLLTAIGPVILFIALNALLLGRDLGEMVAVRHMNPNEMRGWLRVTRGQRAIMGLIITALFSVPFVNIIAPIIGAGIATHMFHRRPV